MEIGMLIISLIGVLWAIGWNIYIHKSGTNDTPPKPGPEGNGDIGNIKQEIWEKVNHSEPVISLVHVKEKRILKELKNIIKKNYKCHRVTSIKKVNEECGTMNYRIKCFCSKPLLLRIHNRINNVTIIKTIHAIQRHIHEEKIFSTFNDCLIPVKTVKGKEYGMHNNKYFSLFPFAENVTHFSAEKEGSIADFALKYGKVQKALSLLEKTLSVHEISTIREEISWFQKDIPLFNVICQINERAIKNPNPSNFVRIFDDNQRMLKKIWNEIKPLFPENNIKRKPTIHDLHPHNTFFEDHTCALIYDYEAVSEYWSDSTALAFTIHRFIREYIRVLKIRNFPPTPHEIKKQVNIFLTNYEKGGMKIPSDFLSQLHLEIKYSNFSKLLGIMCFYFNIKKDPANRDTDFLYEELLKFIIFLKEAEYFKFDSK